MKENDQKQFDNELNRWKNLCEHLLGPIDEIDLEEADQLLAAAGIDTQTLKESFYAKLSEQARSLRAKGEALPPLLAEALKDLRPEWAPARNVEELEQHAERRLDELLRPSFAAAAPAQLAFSYRKKSDLSPEDRQVLDKLAKKLEERIKHK